MQTIIIDKIENHDIEFEDFLDQNKKKELSPELSEIDQILENTIRPGLQADGGDIELIDLDNNILTLKYLGACDSCPSAMTGTLEAIRSILHDQYNEDLEVIAI